MKQFFLLLLIAASSMYAIGQGTVSIREKNKKPAVLTEDRVFTKKNERTFGKKRNIPPGHAKKLYGSRSARAYAPGQRKKAMLFNRNRRNNKKGRF